MARDKRLHQRRPAETAGVAGGGVGAVITSALHLSPEWAAVVTMLVAIVPAVVTYVVTHGGIIGVWNTVIHGSPDAEA